MLKKFMRRLRLQTILNKTLGGKDYENNKERTLKKCKKNPPRFDARQMRKK